MTNSESLYSRAVQYYGLNNNLIRLENLMSPERDYYFAMGCNGFFLGDSDEWDYSSQAIAPIAREFKGQETAFFGPGGYSSFFTPNNSSISPILFSEILRSPKITEVVRKYRELDEDQAAGIAFVFGGAIRYLKGVDFPEGEKSARIKERVEFIAGMTALGERKSGLAIVSAMAMYIMSGGSIESDKDFIKSTFLMGEAIRDDPVEPFETKDLGLSQVLRLRNFRREIQGDKPQPFTPIGEYTPDFDGFPTVGAEFHLPMRATEELPNLWQRLALLNMSQYQPGSYIQFSRKDREVIEVRMNPSIYPVTVANWRQMLGILPELNQTFFTATINRSSDRDLKWRDEKGLLERLQAIGMLTYAGVFGNTPPTARREEVDFGSVYLGQTVKLTDGGYNFTGNWGGGQGEYGQMGIYAGYGNSFPYFMYYLTYVLENPDILRSVRPELLKVSTLDEALALEPNERRRFFNGLQEAISRDERLNKAHESGIKIQELLS